MTAQEKAPEALARAPNTHGSTRNYMVIISGFAAKGIPPAEIKPRENVLTFWAWKALGRRVRKGEHGVKVVTFIECKGKGRKAEQTENVDDQEQKGRPKRSRHSRPWTTTVFHVSQTDPIKQ